MTTQPDAARVERGPITEVPHFALGMADLLERQGFTIAAAELRRLHAQRDALLEALRLIAGLIANEEARQKALDAIAKAEGQQ